MLQEILLDNPVIQLDDARFSLPDVIDTLLSEDQVDLPVVHRFGPGIYIREVFMPAGALVVGHYHKTAHLNMMLSGRMLILNGEGEVEELIAPMTFVSQPGRKVAYILEDVVWQNIHATEETDVETLEDLLLDKGEYQLKLEEKRQLLLLSYDGQNAEYLDMLESLGLTEEQVREISERTDDLIPFPFGSYTVQVADSMIEGKGLFATAPFEEGQVIAPARVNNKRTPAGRYTNHSNHPNAMAIKLDDGDIILVAIRAIKGSKGGMVGEEITIDYRQMLRENLRGEV